MPTVILKTRRSPRPLAGRGMGNFASELNTELNYLPSFPSSLYQNLTTGTLSAAQLQVIVSNGDHDNLIAATDPNTGLVNVALLNQENAQLAAEVASAANVSGQSTGSVIADLADTAQGTGPGFWASLGIGSSSGSSGLPTINWTSLLQTLAIIAALGLGGYFIVKKL